MTAIDPILRADLDAYVDGQLSPERRLEVELFLAGNPARAAEVMADLGIRGQLRLEMGTDMQTGRRETREAARRLHQALFYSNVATRLQRIAAIGLFVTAGWVASTYVGPFRITGAVASEPPPAHVEEAVRAHRTSQLREHMRSQPGVHDYDPEEIRAATAIILPDLPGDWKVVDVQVFPSRFGPSVEMAITKGQDEYLSLFAVRPGAFAVSPVSTYSVDGAEAAEWQIGDVAYALVSTTQKNSGLVAEAERLSRTLY